MFCHASREGKTGVRAWWHFGKSSRSCIHTEFNWWTLCFGAAVSVDDEGWNFHLAIPPLSVWLIFDNCGLWQPKEKHIFTWDNNREVWLPAQRECAVSIHDWTLRFVLWGRSMEWRTSDPWWVRGMSVDLRRLVLGRQHCEVETLKDGIAVVIPMPEGVYRGVAKIERRTWTRPRWFSFSRVSTTIDCPKGIPFAGKGENPWDCGDDGLFGWGAEGESIEHAIAHGIESVLVSRRRYGHASAEAVQKALA